MKQVIIHPEKCVGCMQCMTACATAHSVSLSLTSAVLEKPLPKPRIHVGANLIGRGFPNRCRHCDPAPCLVACLPGAIYREPTTATVLINPDLCINCASCAMACPFGVIRYHEDNWAPPGKTVAIKCDNCVSRQAKGMIPACVEMCKSGALTFEEAGDALQRKTRETAGTIWPVADSLLGRSEGFALLQAIKKIQYELAEAR